MLREQCRKSEWASGRANGPVLTCWFLALLNHRAMFGKAGVTTIHSDSGHHENWKEKTTDPRAQERASERSASAVRSASERANGWASGPLLTFRFQEVLNHCAIAIAICISLSNTPKPWLPRSKPWWYTNNPFHLKRILRNCQHNRIETDNHRFPFLDCSYRSCLNHLTPSRRSS